MSSPCSCLFSYQTFIYLFFLKVSLSRIIRRVQNKNFPSVLQQLLLEICNAKIVNTSCVNIRRSYYFSSEEVLQGLSKNNPTKNQVDAESQAILKHAPGRKRTEEKMFYWLSQQVTKPNCKLKILASKCVSHTFCYLDCLLLQLLESWSTCAILK